MVEECPELPPLLTRSNGRTDSQNRQVGQVPQNEINTAPAVDPPNEDDV